MRVEFILIIIAIFFILSISISHKTYDKNNTIRVLVRQSARWSNAAVNDNNPIIAVLHANYGAGYLWALKDLFTDSEISKAADIDIIDFQRRITNIQDDAARQLKNSCPESLGSLDPILTEISSRKFKSNR